MGQAVGGDGGRVGWWRGRFQVAADTRRGDEVENGVYTQMHPRAWINRRNRMGAREQRPSFGSGREMGRLMKGRAAELSNPKLRRYADQGGSYSPGSDPTSLLELSRYHKNQAEID